jgi:hypothetical protein
MRIALSGLTKIVNETAALMDVVKRATLGIGKGA